jgi:ribosomal protein L12E/L44/L45/RPP1/RPP2
LTAGGVEADSERLEKLISELGGKDVNKVIIGDDTGIEKREDGTV